MRSAPEDRDDPRCKNLQTWFLMFGWVGHARDRPLEQAQVGPSSGKATLLLKLTDHVIFSAEPVAPSLLLQMPVRGTREPPCAPAAHDLHEHLNITKIIQKFTQKFIYETIMLNVRPPILPPPFLSTV